MACQLRVPALLASSYSIDELQNVVENAIARVVLKHPLMHVGLIGETTKKPAWVRLNRLNLRHHINWRIVHNEENFRDVRNGTIQVEVDTKFSDFKTMPGWRIVILHQEDTDLIEMLLVFNHTNMDAVSVKIFLDDLLETLNSRSIDLSKPKPDIENHILELHNPTTRCPPPAEHLTKFPIDRDIMIKAVWSQIKSSISPLNNPTQADWAPIQQTPYKTKFRSFTLANDTLVEVIQACRNNNTTITGLLHALSLASLCSLLDDSKVSAFESLTALDVRRFLPATHPRYPGLEPARAMANYVTILSHFFDANSVSQVRSKTAFVDDDDGLPSADLLATVWSVASDTRQQIKKKLDMGLRNDMIGFMKPIADWRAEMSRAVLKPRRASWVVTNLGVLDSHSSNAGLDKTSGSSSSSSANHFDQEWSIREAQFVLSANVPASALSISPVAVKGRSLCVTVSWQECVLGKGIGERFVGDLERWMRFIGKGAEGSLSGGESSTLRHE